MPGPPGFAFGPTVIADGGYSALSWETLVPADVRSLGHSCLLAHGLATVVDPDGVVDGAINCFIGVDCGAEALMPALVRVLRASRRPGNVVAAFEGLE